MFRLKDHPYLPAVITAYLPACVLLAYVKLVSIREGIHINFFLSDTVFAQEVLGEVAEMPDPDSVTDEEWADFVWFANNTAGAVREWWYHVPTSYWFIAERDTVTDEIIRTYPSAEVFRSRRDFTAGEESQGG